MVSKCANPACAARFLYMHKGKLYRFELEAQPDKGPSLGLDPTMRKHSNGVQFFWLCEKCSASMTLVLCKGIGVTVHPLHRMLKAAS